MAGKGEQVALVACDEDVGLRGLCHCQQKVVVGVRRDVHRRQVAHDGCQSPEVVDQSSSLGRVNAEADAFTPSDAADFFDLQFRCDQGEAPVAPRLIKLIRGRSSRDQRRNQNVGVEEEAHSDYDAFDYDAFDYDAFGAAGHISLRTAAHASSIAACRSPTSTSALRAFTP